MFVALWPESALQESLAAVTREAVLASGGHPVPPQNFHLTLAFLGSVPQASIGTLQAVAGAVARQVPSAALQITLDVIEYWRKARVLCVTNRVAQPSTDTAGVMLAEVLKARLLAVGFEPDLQPFRPHVTLARKARHPPAATPIKPITWNFIDCVLVASKRLPAGSAYTVLARFPFGQ